MDQTVQQGVIELGVCWRSQPAEQMRYKSISVYIVSREILEPNIDDVLEMLEHCSACDVFIKISIEFPSCLDLLESSLLRAFLVVLVGIGGGILEVLEELGLQHCIDRQHREVQLYRVTAEEPLHSHFRILDLLLEVDAEVFVLVASQVRLHSVRVPEHLLVNCEVSSIDHVDH